jgi:enediyne biosynthesis protein E4
MIVARRRAWLALAALLIALATIVGGWTAWENRRYRDAITAIEAEMAAGRHAIAARTLSQLTAWNDDSDEAAYLLGVCEKARGRYPAAADAWARVTPGSSFSSRAIEARMTLDTDSGRFAAAEQLINDAASDPRNDRTALQILLLPIFSVQGRLEEARRLVIERWQHLQETGEGTSELAINLARLHFEMQAKPQPVEAVRASLEQAASLAPDDDRVWLGRANLAIQTGHHDEARCWLDQCRQLRPDDASVWRALLNLGLATGRIEDVHLAIARLPAIESPPAQARRIAAWLARKQGDHAAEQEALERLIADEPADVAAIDRLAELAQQAVQPERTAQIQRHRAEINRLQARYQKLYDRNQPIRDAAEMGRLAERLGRAFEARAFLTVAVAESLDPDHARRELERFMHSTIPVTDTNKSVVEGTGNALTRVR